MADKKKKPSGFQNRKRKAEEEKSLAKIKGSFLKYVKQKQNETSNIPVHTEHIGEGELEIAMVNLEGQNDMNEEPVVQEIKEVKPSTSESLIETQCEDYCPKQTGEVDEILSASKTDRNYTDPATWDGFDDEFRQDLVQHGPTQISDFSFPLDDNRRKFSVVHYKRRLVNGECLHREWLMYSTTKNAVFCFCCILFSSDSTGSANRSAMCGTGVSDWKNISAILASHEKSHEHMSNFQKWKELEIRLKKNKTIDEEHLRKIREEEKYWHQVLERLIALVRVLGTQNLAFRGSNENLFACGNGNFLKFVEYLAMFDPIMREHIRKISDNETRVHYLGKNIQNELIQLLSNAIQENILSAVNNAKYFSVVLDCTPDVAHVEQMTIIVRFVSTTKEKKSCDIREHFLGFIPVSDTTGAGLTEAVLAKLKDLSLPVENLRGQGYDNGSNMKGKNVGLQRRILDMNPRAFYVPCSSHSLNLVVNDAAKCCLGATAFFCLVQHLYVFFSASTQRWEVLLRHLPSLTLKPLSDTRWESRVDALLPLRYQLSEVHDALMDIVENSELSRNFDNVSRVEAEGLAKQIGKFEFVASLVVWYNILYEINLTSKLLQTKTFDLSAATKQLNKTREFLEKSRSDDGFEKMLVDAREIAEDLDIPTTFEQDSTAKRLKKKKRQFSYKGNDDPIQEPKQKFKVNFYFAILDTAISSVTERFNQLQEINSKFGFLYHIDELEEKPTQLVLDHCVKLEKALTHNQSKDIDAIELCGELQAISRRITKQSTPKDVLDFILESDLEENVPNLYVALRILLTLPVTVASGERSFSKLKLIKTYLRSSMTQERLVGLATISIEQELAQRIDLNGLVGTFAKQKARKHKM